MIDSSVGDGEKIFDFLCFRFILKKNDLEPPFPILLIPFAKLGPMFEK